MARRLRCSSHREWSLFCSLCKTRPRPVMIEEFSNLSTQVPYVPGINEYREKFTDRIVHSKVFRTAREYAGQKVIIIGNSASGYDVAHILVASKLLKGPVYVSRRSPGRWVNLESSKQTFLLTNRRSRTAKTHQKACSGNQSS